MSDQSNYRRKDKCDTGQIVRSAFSSPKSRLKGPAIVPSTDRKLLLELYQLVKETSEASGTFEPAPGSVMHRVRERLFGKRNSSVETIREPGEE